MPDEYDQLLDSLSAPARPTPVRPRGREKFVPANSSWSVSDINKVKDFYRSKTGRDLPVRNFGQGEIHNSQGWDHRNAADVGLNPSTPQGQELLSYLRSNNIPFNAFTGPARSRTGKIASTGAHIHIGLPSHSTNQRYAVGTTLNAQPVQDTGDEYDKLLDSLSAPAPQAASVQPRTSRSSYGTPELQPKVTSTVREDVDFDAPLPDELPGVKPIKFDPFQTSDLSLTQRIAAGGARLGGADLSSLPENSPERGGKLIKATVKTDGNSYPNANQLSDAMLEAMGAAEIGQRYRAETGNNIATPAIGLDELKRGYDPRTKSYSFTIQPTSADVRVLNAYRTGGVKGAQDEIQKMRGESAREVEQQTAQKTRAGEIARSVGIDPASISEGNGPIAKGVGDAAIGMSRLINNASAVFSDDPQGSADNAEFIEQMSAAIPEEKSTVGRIARGVSGAVASLPRYANPAAPLVAYTENLNRGQEAGVKEGLKFGAAGAVAHGAGLATEGLSPFARQLTARGAAGATNAALDYASGERDVGRLVESGVVGAALPIGGKRGEKPAERGTLFAEGEPRVERTVPPVETQEQTKQPSEWNHLDFGRVTEAESQKGVARGSVRVVDGEGVEHVIQRSNGRGAGNQRAIPMKSEAPAAAPTRFGRTAEPISRERALPQSLERAGLAKGEDTTYDPITNKESLAAAQNTIRQKGLDGARADLYQKKELSAEDTATGIELIRLYQSKGNLEAASEVAGNLSKKLTEAGQAVQAASIIARLSPEGVLLTAQRQLESARPGTKLTTEQQKGFTEDAARVREAEAKVSTLEKQIAELQMKATTRAPRPKLESLQERLQKAESEARARLAARVGVGKGSQTGASTIPLDIADYAIIGASKLAQKGITFAKWSSDMASEFGDEIKPRLRAIYRESYRQYDELNKEMRQASERRGALRGQPEGLSDAEVQKLIDQRVRARKDARTARVELARRFEDLTLTTGGKIKRVAGDVLNIPKTMKSSVDLSAPRQAAMWMATHPVEGARVFFGKQIRAMREKNFDKYVDELMSDPDYPLMQRAGLDLTTTPKSGALSAREEAFMSKLAGKVPGVKQSERAYTTFLDTARVSWFKQLKAQAEDAAKVQGKAITPEQYKAIANFVNIGTGRGNLGRGALNNASPILNALFFAPKYAASKVQVFDPRVYARLPEGARKTAMRQAVQYFATVATVGMLLKHGFNQNVSTDPEESDFMKLKVGNTRYDLTFGQGQYVVLGARLFRNAKNWAEGKSDDRGKTAGDNIQRFLRYKLAPIPAAALNIAQGKNAVGEKTDAKTEGLQLITPLFLNDLYSAYQQEGLTGVAKTAPGFVGVGVNTYGARPQTGRGTPRPTPPPRPR